MLGKNSYPPAYVQQCRTNVDDLVKAYRKVATATKGDASVAKFAPLLFNHLVLALDEYFVHRLRAVEGKDGNPLNEVRIIADSLMLHDGVFTVEKSIKLQARVVRPRHRARRRDRPRREELHQARRCLLRRDRSQVQLVDWSTPLHPPVQTRVSPAGSATSPR